MDPLIKSQLLFNRVSQTGQRPKCWAKSPVRVRALFKNAGALIELKTSSATVSATRSSSPTNVVLLGRSAVRQAQSKHDPTISSFGRLHGYGISRTNVDRRRALTPTTPRCTSA